MNRGDAPAFPVSWQQAGQMVAEPGMSLRAYLAGQALAGVLANPSLDASFEGYASDAVQYADALLAELAKAKP